MELVKKSKKSNPGFSKISTKDLLDIYGAKGLSVSNKKSLMDMIDYLSKIKKEGSISNEKFTDLIVLACSHYIENEVELRVSKAIGDRFNSFLRNL